jgi:limonene-1,2-epoxide hydrolase
MHERTDHFSLGDEAVALPIRGVFEIDNGRINSWREYFDPSRFAGQTTSGTDGERLMSGPP